MVYQVGVAPPSLYSTLYLMRGLVAISSYQLFSDLNISKYTLNFKTPYIKQVYSEIEMWSLKTCLFLIIPKTILDHHQKHICFRTNYAFHVREILFLFWRKKYYLSIRSNPVAPANIWSAHSKAMLPQLYVLFTCSRCTLETLDCCSTVKSSLLPGEI